MSTTTTGRTRAANAALWTAQVILALLFLFAGVAKLRMSAALLEQFTGVPGALMKFIAVAESAGAGGLVLPGLFRVRRFLTPVAATGLVTIMAGAVTLTASHGPIAGALVPLIVGTLAGTVAHGRRAWARCAGDLPAGTWVGTPVHGD